MTTREPVLSRFPGFAAEIKSGEDEDLSEKLRKAETIGRPLGAPASCRPFLLLHVTNEPAGSRRSQEQLK